MTHGDPMFAASAAEARSILREDAPRTAPERAAVDALDQYRWVMVHAHDYSLGVIRLLSNAGLLRDKAEEKLHDDAARSEAKFVAEKRRADAVAIHNLATAITQASDRLSAGDDPGEVAAWLKEVRAHVMT